MRRGSKINDVSFTIPVSKSGGEIENNNDDNTGLGTEISLLTRSNKLRTFQTIIKRHLMNRSGLEVVIDL